jgi:antitoxin HicB
VSDSRLRYAMLIQWSDEDDAYLVSLPEWEGRVFNPVTHGASYEEAARHGREALDGVIASSLKHGEPLPEPRPYRPLVPSP